MKLGHTIGVARTMKSFYGLFAQLPATTAGIYKAYLNKTVVKAEPV